MYRETLYLSNPGLLWVNENLARSKNENVSLTFGSACHGTGRRSWRAPRLYFTINEECKVRKMNLRVILVEPRYDGNIGSVARSMKNFGFDQLVLVNPCRIEDYGSLP